MKELFLGRHARILYMVAVVTSFVVAAGASKKFA
jgi:hypothetical protein